MQKKKQNNTIKQIIILIIAVILLLLLIFAEDIIKLTNKNKINLAQNSENELISNEPNVPQLSAGMIPVKWDGTDWIITTSKDKDWYDYANGKPAYIMLNDGKYQSELIRDMTNKELAENNVGVGVPDDPNIRGTIFVWMPRFAYKSNEENKIETRYINEGTYSSVGWTVFDTFSYTVADETKPDFYLSGVWIEKDVDTAYENKIAQMNQEESIYGFIANTKPSQVVGVDIASIYFASDTEVCVNPMLEIDDALNTNRIILKVVNTNKIEPIKAKAEYTKQTGVITVQVTYSKYKIDKIKLEDKYELDFNEINGIVYSSTAGIELEDGTNTITIIDKQGNTKELSVYVTGYIYVALYEDGTLAFGKNENPIPTKTLKSKYGDIQGQNFTLSSLAPWVNERTNITTVEFVNKISPTSTALWFDSCTKLNKINNIQNLNTKNVTSMYYMFGGCSNLAELDLTNFNTSKVTNMCGMFLGCESVARLDLSNFNTTKVTDMQAMFVNCYNLTELDLSNFDTSKVTNMLGMFINCYNLTKLDLSNFNTSNVINMASMFNGCYNLANLDLTSFDTRKVTNMSNMFAYCGVLNKLDLSNFDTSNVTNNTNMFMECASLSEINFGQRWNKEVTLPEGTTWYKDISFTEKIAEGGAVYTPIGAITIYGKILEPGIYVKLYQSNTLVFATHNGKIPRGDSKDYGNILGKEFTDTNKAPWDDVKTNITTVEFVNKISPTSTAMWFNGCSNLSKINNIQNLDTSNVTNMYGMFEICSKLTELDLSNFDTSKVTNMEYMFRLCSSLTNLDLSNFNTSKVINMDRMFQNCKNLTELVVSNFDTSNVTNMDGIFENCSNLTKLNLSNFKTSRVTDMRFMFSGCTNLQAIYVGENWVTTQADTTNMFYNCGVDSVTKHT